MRLLVEGLSGQGQGRRVKGGKGGKGARGGGGRSRERGAGLGGNLLIVEDYVGPPDVVRGHVQHVHAAVLLRLPTQLVVVPGLKQKVYICVNVALLAVDVIFNGGCCKDFHSKVCGIHTVFRGEIDAKMCFDFYRPVTRVKLALPDKKGYLYSYVKTY